MAVATVTDSRGRGVAVATVTDSIAYPNTLLMYYIGKFFPLFFHISIVDFGLWTFLSQYIAYPNTLLMYYIGNFFHYFFIYIDCGLWTLDFPIPIHCLSQYIAFLGDGCDAGGRRYGYR